MSIKKLLGQEEEEKLIDTDCLPSLSWKQRIYGFGICFSLGFIVGILSYLQLGNLIKGKPAPFAILYTFGNILSLSSSFFLSGPCKQLKSMFKATRIIATLLYLFFMALTLVLALTHQKAILVLLSIFCQWIALIWYCLSYIPYARKLATKCCASMIGE